MAFCSYFKIQPVAGGADRIKKSEWKLVSHDNSQPLRERQLLLPVLLLLLSPDSASLAASVTISLFPPSAFRACVFRLFSWLAARAVPLSVTLSPTSRPSVPRPLLFPHRAIHPIYLSHSRYLRYHRRRQPSLSPSSTALNTTAIYTYI